MKSGINWTVIRILCIKTYLFTNGNKDLPESADSSGGGDNKHEIRDIILSRGPYHAEGISLIYYNQYTLVSDVWKLTNDLETSFLSRSAQSNILLCRSP
jgi:hypothetical protein